MSKEKPFWDRFNLTFFDAVKMHKKESELSHYLTIGLVVIPRRRLEIERSWVRIPTLDTIWITVHFNLSSK